MKIGIDCRLWFQGGVGRYTRNLVTELLKQNNKTEYVLFFFEADKNRIVLPKHNHAIKKVFTTSRWHSFSEQTTFLKLLNNEEIDLMHFTYFSHPLLYRKPFVLTVHDLTVQKRATGQATTRNKLIYGAKYWASHYVLLHGIRHAKRIVVPSRNVEKDLVSYSDKSVGKVVVSYEGVDSHIIKAKATRPKKVSNNFALYVGNCYPHKNISIFKSLLEEIPELQLVMASPDDYFTRRFINELPKNIKNRISVLSKVTDGELKWLYSKAKALIFPSFAEGFGLPIVEASAFNCPLILSDIPVFREIAPLGALFFDPQNDEELIQRYRQAIKTTTTYPKQWRQSFSFHKMAKETYGIYQSTLNE